MEKNPDVLLELLIAMTKGRSGRGDRPVNGGISTPAHCCLPGESFVSTRIGIPISDG